MRTRALAAVAACVAALALAACGGTDPSTVDNVAPAQPVGDPSIANPYAGGAVAKTAPKDTILMSGLLFYPKKLTVTPGQEIALINEDSSTHDVRTRDAKTISSGNLDGGKKSFGHHAGQNWRLRGDLPLPLGDDAYDGDRQVIGTVRG